MKIGWVGGLFGYQSVSVPREQALLIGVNALTWDEILLNHWASCGLA